MTADAPMKPFRPGLLYYALAAAVIGLVAVYGFLTDAPVSRYQSHPDHYEMIFRQEGPVDLLALGSSRLMSFFDARVMAGELERRSGRPAVVYDLSKPWIGNGITYVMLRDFFERRRVGRILVEFKYTGGLYNPTLYEIATYGDIIDGNLVRSGRPLYVRGQEVLRLVSKKMIRQATLWVKGERRDLAGLGTGPARTTEVHEFHPVHSMKVRLARDRMEGAWRGQPALQWPLGLPEERRNEYYLRRITAMARAHGAEPVFIHIPVIYGPALAEDFARRVEEAFGVRVLQPPREILEAVYPEGFADTYHANRYGSAVVSRWLAGELYGRDE